MSSDVYELLALAMRYWFILLALLITFRAWRACVTDNRSQRLLRDWAPDAGSVGEFLVVEDPRARLLGQRYPVPAEGILGSGRVADVRINRRGIASRHYYMTYRDGLLLLTPLSPLAFPGGAVLRDGDSLEINGLTLLLTFYSVEDAGPVSEPNDEFEDIIW